MVITEDSILQKIINYEKYKKHVGKENSKNITVRSWETPSMWMKFLPMVGDSSF